MAKQCQLVCSRVPPAPVYKGARGEAGRPLGRAKEGRIPPPSRSRTPPFLVPLGIEGRGEGERKGGRPPHPIRIGLGGAPS